MNTTMQERATKPCCRKGWLLAFACMVACGGHHASSGSDEPEPIAECQDYESVLVTCTGSGAGFAKQALARAKTPEDRAHIRELCAVNAQRMRSACR